MVYPELSIERGNLQKLLYKSNQDLNRLNSELWIRLLDLRNGILF